MIDPKLLCNKHLIGEHGEIHKHWHVFVKQYRINKRISPIVQIEPQSMQDRHDALADEMLRRGMNHKSPYIQPDISYLPEHQRYAHVDMQYNLRDLMNRCCACMRRIQQNNANN
jgi:Pyrimidine dimer DNA glycosylase